MYKYRLDNHHMHKVQLHTIEYEVLYESANIYST